MSSNPSTIPRVSGCLAIVAAATVAASCGGAQSASDAAVQPLARHSVPAPSRARVPGPATVGELSPSPALRPRLSLGPLQSTDPALTATAMVATVPAIDATKIPKAAVGYSTEMLAPTSQQPMYTDIGAFRTVCEFSHMSFDDPIVYPGQPGRSHLHAFFGNTGINANSTVESVATSGNSTCRGGTANRTGYWVPAIIDTRDGTPVKPDSLITYYKTGYRGIAPAAVQPMPAGLRMIAGDSTATSPTAGGIAIFNCFAPATGQGPKTVELPTTCPVGNTIWATVTFPQCWDGVNLDSPDHKSHMAYPVDGACPKSHPVPFPEVTLNFAYTVTDAAAVARWRLASDNYDPSIPAGYSLHADWFNGWKPEIMGSFIRNCDQASRDCFAHLLGNGQMMLGAGA